MPKKQIWIWILEDYVQILPIAISTHKAELPAYKLVLTHVNEQYEKKSRTCIKL